MSLPRTLKNNKSEIGENRTRYPSFGGYMARDSVGRLVALYNYQMIGPEFDSRRPHRCYFRECALETF